MKNIYILPTDKPSRFSLNSSGKYHLTNQLHTNSPNFTNQHIYITNDVEIKEGDWYLDIDLNKVCKNINPNEVSFNTLKKIILTTDSDLIKDGVQIIDDEFLEWFVKNPGCEYVKVEIDYSKSVMNYSYKIIIPKEESKQIDEKGNPLTYWGGLEEPKQPKTFKELFANTGIEPTTDENGNIQYNFKATMKEEPKQETREYDLLQHIKFCLECKNESQAIRLIEKYGFQKQERMYNEEEVQIKLYECLGHFAQKHNIIINGSEIDKWFEQFKKK